MGVIVTGLEVIEAGFEVVDVATVAEGVILVQSVGVGVSAGTGTAGGVAPSVVGIRYDCITLRIQNSDNVTLEVYRIEVCSAIKVHSQGRAQCVITDSQSVVYRFIPCVGDGYLRDLRTVVDILDSSVIVEILGYPQTVGVVGKGSRVPSEANGTKLAAMLPSVRPEAVIQRIADSIIGDGLTVVGSEQVAPVGITVGIVDGIQKVSQRTGGIGVLLPAGDVTGVIIVVPVRPAYIGVILPEELILGVVNVGDLVGTIADVGNIAIVIVIVVVGYIIAVAVNGNSTYPVSRRTVRIGLIGVVQVGDGGIPLLGGLAEQTTIGIIGIGFRHIAVGNRFHPVVIVVGVGGGGGGAIDGFLQAGEVVQLVVGVAHGVAEIGTRLGVLHHPVCEIVVVPGGEAAGRILHCRQRAAVVVLIGNGIVILVGLAQQATVCIVSILYHIIIAIFKL